MRRFFYGALVLLIFGVSLASAYAAGGEYATYLPLLQKPFVLALPDGLSAVLTRGRDLALATPDGTTLVTLPPADDENTGPNPSPNGRHIAYFYQGSGDNAFGVLDLTTGRTTRLSRWSSQNERWSPDGNWLLYHFDDAATNTVTLWVYNPATGVHRQVASEVGFTSRWLPSNEELVYAATRNGVIGIYRISRNGGAETLVYTPGDLNAIYDVLPDGRILFRDGSNLYLVGVDGQGLVQLTNDSTPKNFTQASPDGTRIAYFDGKDMVIVSDTGQPVARLVHECGADICFVSSYFSWSPDGAEIAYTYTRKMGDQYRFTLYRAAADGSESTGRVVVEPGRNVAFSPDGDYLAYEVEGNGGHSIAFENRTTGATTILSDPDTFELYLYGWRVPPTP